MDNKREIIKRINYVTGQLQGIKKMIEDDRDCLSVLQQMKASKSGMESLMALFAYGEICHNQMDNEKLKKVIRSI